MALDPSRAAEVKSRAVLLWSYLVPFCIENKNAYLGMPCVGKSHRGTPPLDDESVPPSGKDDVVEDDRLTENIGTTEDPVNVPYRYPTHKMIYDYIVANEATAGDASKLLQLYNHCELTGPIPLDHRTTKRPNDVGFYVTLDVRSSSDGNLWRIQACKCWGDPDWASSVEERLTDMGWKVVEEE